MDGKNDEKETKAEDIALEQPKVTESLKSKEESMICFDGSNNSDKTKESQNKKTKLIKYISMVLIIVLLALGIFLISSIFSKSSDIKPEKIENTQKPDKRPERRHHGSSSDQNASSQQSPDKPIEATVPSKPNSNSQSGGGTGSLSSSVPNKLQNALSSQANQSGANNNGGTNGQAHSSGGNSHNDNTTTINLNQATQHGEEVVSSDQQNAIEAVNSGKKKP